MHAIGDMRSDVAHRRALDRADVGNNRSLFEMRTDGFGDFLVGTDRRAQDDEIGAFHGIDGIGIGFRDEAKSLGLSRRLRASTSNRRFRRRGRRAAPRG